MEVFAAAEITNSSRWSRRPSNSRAWRSSTRAALDSKLGSRGKTQLRWVQASSSQRQMVAQEICATSPRLTTSVWMSGTWSRENGRPSRAGNSQAMALTATTSSGGKNWAPVCARALRESGQTFLEEAFPPLGDDLEGQVEPAGDLLVLQSLCGHEDDLGPDDVAIR